MRAGKDDAMRFVTIGFVGLGLAMSLVSFATSPATAQTSVATGVYTEADAARGQAAYASQCATCHGRSLKSNGDAPSLVEEPFAFGWKGKTLAERFKVIKETMPPDDPGTLPDETIRDVMTYILKVNGYPAGSTAFPADATGLEQIIIPR
jgi:mono/diheme cytochrome c family protein